MKAMKLKKVCWYNFGEILFVFNPVAIIYFFVYFVSEELGSVLNFILVVAAANLVVLSTVKVVNIRENFIYQSWAIKTPFTKSQVLRWKDIEKVNFKILGPRYGERNSIKIILKRNNKIKKIEFWAPGDFDDEKLINFFKSKRVKVIIT